MLTRDVFTHIELAACKDTGLYLKQCSMDAYNFDIEDYLRYKPPALFRQILILHQIFWESYWIQT